jgi:catalase
VEVNMNEKNTLTTDAGIPVGDNQNSLTAGPLGPLLVQDWQPFERHAHFNRERIPERVVHAKGSGAYAMLTITHDITRYSKAKVFSTVGQTTECFIRFSTVAGERGAADAERDVRGFEVEQAAFEPSNVVPGVGSSPDKMLQFRIFADADAHRYRLGSANYASLPVNRPHATAAHTYHRDGFMRFDGNSGGSVNYEPNSFGGPVEDPRYKQPPLQISGDADRYDHRAGNDEYTQAGNLFRLLPADEQQRLFSNIAASMQGVPRVVIDRQLEHFRKADPAYGEGVAKALSLSRGKGHKAHAAD